MSPPFYTVALSYYFLYSSSGFFFQNKMALQLPLLLLNLEDHGPSSGWFVSAVWHSSSSVQSEVWPYTRSGESWNQSLNVFGSNAEKEGNIQKVRKVKNLKNLKKVNNCKWMIDTYLSAVFTCKVEYKCGIAMYCIWPHLYVSKTIGWAIPGAIYRTFEYNFSL